MKTNLFSRGPLLAGALGLLLEGAAAGIAAEKEIHVRGRIVGHGAAGVSGSPVRLFKTRRSLSVGRFSSGGQVAEAARTTTDDNGFFELRISKDRSYDDYFLRFHDPETFDRVRFLAPEDREITRLLKSGGALIVDVELVEHPDWPAVRRRIEGAGEESAMAKILRSLGLPERQMTGAGLDGPREEWWYHTRGIVYFFRDGVPLGYRRFEPVLGLAQGAEGPGV